MAVLNKYNGINLRTVGESPSCDQIEDQGSEFGTAVFHKSFDLPAFGDVSEMLGGVLDCFDNQYNAAEMNLEELYARNDLSQLVEMAIWDVTLESAFFGHAKLALLDLMQKEDAKDTGLPNLLPAQYSKPDLDDTPRSSRTIREESPDEVQGGMLGEVLYMRMSGEDMWNQMNAEEYI